MSEHEQLSLFDFKNPEPATPSTNFNRDLIPTDDRMGTILP